MADAAVGVLNARRTAGGRVSGRTTGAGDAAGVPCGRAAEEGGGTAREDGAVARAEEGPPVGALSVRRSPVAAGRRWGGTSL